MQRQILNYRIIIESETNNKTGKTVYNAYAPTLGVADWGNTVEEAEKNIHEAITCHIESLVKHQKSVPHPDSQEYTVKITSIELPTHIHPIFS